MPLIERRYAQALVNIGLSNNMLDKNFEDLKAVNDSIESNTELKSFLSSPVFKIKEKLEIIEKIFSQDGDKTVTNFIKVIVEKGRASSIGEIFLQYAGLVNEIKKCLNIKVITATEIAQDQLDQIGQKMKQKYGSNDINIVHVIDSSIIGGIIVRVGDKLIDGSIKGKLEGIAQELTIN